MNCKAQTPILESIKKDYPNVEFCEINASKETEIAQKYDVSTLPTLVFERDDVVFAKLMGLKPKSVILKTLTDMGL